MKDWSTDSPWVTLSIYRSTLSIYLIHPGSIFRSTLSIYLYHLNNFWIAVSYPFSYFLLRPLLLLPLSSSLLLLLPSFSVFLFLLFLFLLPSFFISPPPPHSLFFLIFHARVNFSIICSKEKKRTGSKDVRNVSNTRAGLQCTLKFHSWQPTDCNQRMEIVHYPWSTQTIVFDLTTAHVELWFRMCAIISPGVWGWVLYSNKHSCSSVLMVCYVYWVENA